MFALGTLEESPSRLPRSLCVKRRGGGACERAIQVNELRPRLVQKRADLPYLHHVGHSRDDTHSAYEVFTAPHVPADRAMSGGPSDAGRISVASALVPDPTRPSLVFAPVRPTSTGHL